jgi:hypothetical protein
MLVMAARKGLPASLPNAARTLALVAKLFAYLSSTEYLLAPLAYAEIFAVLSCKLFARIVDGRKI